jgi:hypothetical protein
MPLPIFNNQGSTGNGTAITANGNFLTILSDKPSVRVPAPPAGQNSGSMIDLATYYIAAGTGISAGTVTFQELGADGTFRNLASPAAITLAASTNYNGVLNGPFHGLQIVVAALAGGNITYAELKGTVRQI